MLDVDVQELRQACWPKESSTSPHAKSKAQAASPYIEAYLAELETTLQQELKSIHYYPKRRFTPHETPPPTSGSQANSVDLCELRKNRLLGIVSEPGMGKTSLLHEIALKEIGDGHIPLYVDLHQAFAKDYQHFTDHVWSCTYQYDGISMSKLQTEDLEKRRFCFLFDHLDLLPPASGSGNTPEVIDFIGSFADERVNDRLVVCCRVNYDSYYSKLRVFKFYRLLPLDDQEIDILLKDYGIEQLHPDPHTNFRLKELARNPYYLSMLDQLLREKDNKIGQELYTESDLYDQFVNLHLQREEPRRATTSTEGLKKGVLAWLSFTSVISDVEEARQLRKGWVKDQLTRIAPQVGSNLGLDALDCRAAVQEIGAEGLISLTSSGTTYRFAHPSLRDFFAAWHLAKYSPETIQDIVESAVGHPTKVLDHALERILVLCCGLKPNVGVTIRLIADSDRIQDDIFSHNLLLAFSCLVEARTDVCEDELTTLYDRLVDVLTTHPSCYTHSKLRRMLPFIAGARVREKLYLSLLSDVRPEVRDAALGSLLMLPDEIGQIWPIIEEWIYDDDPAKQSSAIQVFYGTVGGVTYLEENNSEELLSALCSILDYGDTDVRPCTISLLGFLGSAEIIPLLVECISIGDRWITWNAVEAASRIDSTHTLSLLWSRRYRHPEYITALGFLFVFLSDEQDYLRDVARLLASLLNHPEDQVRSAVFEAIEEVHDMSDIVSFLQPAFDSFYRLRNDPNIEIRRASLSVLMQMDPDRMRYYLRLSEQEEGENCIRSEKYAIALQKYESKDDLTLDEYKMLIRSLQESTSSGALSRLFAQSPDSCIELLLDMLFEDDSNWWMLEHIADLLVSKLAGPPKASCSVQTLVKLQYYLEGQVMASNSPASVERVLRLLSIIAPRRTLEIIIGQVDELPLRAVRVGGELPPEIAFEALSQLYLENPKSEKILGALEKMSELTGIKVTSEALSRSRLLPPEES